MNLAPIALILFSLWVFSPDKQLFAIASVLLLFLINFSWRKNEPKIIFFGAISYWLTVCTLMIFGVFYNRPMTDLTLTANTFVYTTYLALTATFLYSTGLFIGLRKIPEINVELIMNELKKYDSRKLLYAYITFSIFSTVFGGVVLSFGGLSQLGVALIWMKWSFLTLLIIHTLLFPENKKYVYLVLVFEVLLSFSGFWSSFKDYFFIAAAAFLTFSNRLNTKRIIGLGLAGGVFFYMMVIWNVVKGDYRMYLTGGKKTQVVAQESKIDNIKRLFEIVGEKFSKDNFNANLSVGIESLANRVNYTEYFALSVAQVPDILPFEKGALLMGGLEHVFKPRLFFPDKKTIDDSQMTSKYTGRGFSGADQGVSFSLGLVAERYIDYGPFFMFIPIFLFGLLLAFIYKYIFTHSFNHVWGISFVAPLFFLVPSLGIATTKFLGWLLTYFIAWFFANKYLIEKVNKLLLKV